MRYRSDVGGVNWKSGVNPTVNLEYTVKTVPVEMDYVGSDKRFETMPSGSMQGLPKTRPACPSAS